MRTKILVDHGSAHNLGDTSMLEGAVTRLQALYPDHSLAVIERPLLRTRLYDRAGIERYPVYNVARPLSFEGSTLRQQLERYTLAVSKRLIGREAAKEHQPFGLLGSTFSGGAIQLAQPCGTYQSYIEPFEALHIVGGGNLTDTFNVLPRLLLIRAFLDAGKPVVLTGQQIGPVRSSVLRDRMGRLLRRASFVGLREPTDSVQFCKGARIDPSRYALMGDDSFGMEACSDERTQSLLDKYGLRSGHYVAVNVRVAKYAHEHEAHLRGVAELLDHLSDHLNLPFLVVPIAFNEADSDVVAGQALASLTGRSTVHVFDDPALSVAEAKGLLRHAYGAVGVSYHFCTFALSEGVPAVCIYAGDYYGQKARGLAAFWGDDRLSVYLGEHNVADTSALLEEVWADNGLREDLSNKRNDFKARWMEAFDKAAARLAQ